MNDFKVSVKDKNTHKVIEEYLNLSYTKGQDLKMKLAHKIDFTKYYIEMNSMWG